ncbi:MAG: glycosyltransferase family 4 protein [Candidatus Cloacimonetes bacterium]|nr:glycosyltransferase family 4 protein [Candidatus Cloacimonadota bacterium]
MKYKVLYIVSILKESGPTNQLYNIINNLDRTTFEPKIITLSPEPPNTLIEKFVEKNINVESLNLSRIKGLFLAKKMLLKKIKKFSPDIIHTSGIRADSLLSNFKEYNVINTIRNYPLYDYPMKYGKIKGTIAAINHLNVIRNSKNPIACSKSIAEIFQIKHNIHLKFIQNGINTSIYNSIDKSEKIKIRKKLQISIDKKIFITVGSLIPRKNIETIIQGYNNSKFNNSMLLIAGDGFEREKLKKQIHNNKSIILLGNVNNVNDYLKASDYFISASKAEGLPNTVLEAMACGLPCILSNIPAHKEIFTFSSLSNFLFNTKKIDELSRKIENIDKCDYKNISNDSLNIIRNNFTASLMSKKYQKLYGSIINEK